MKYRPEKTLAEAAKADSRDLLDRVTVFREGMEPEAVEIIEAELARRGIGPDEIRQHHQQLKHRVLLRTDGLPARCALCPRAATESARGWFRLMRLIPLFPQNVYYCDEHWAKRQGKGAR
jgi:hypothetical protein